MERQNRDAVKRKVKCEAEHVIGSEKEHLRNRAFSRPPSLVSHSFKVKLQRSSPHAPPAHRRWRRSRG